MLYQRILGYLGNNAAPTAVGLHKELGVPDHKARKIMALHRQGIATENTLSRLLTNARRGRKPHVATPVTAEKTGFRTAVDAESFRKQFDVPAKIKAALSNLSDQVILDNDFRAELSIPVNHWKIASSKPEFTRYRLEVKGKFYWGQPGTLAKIKKTIDIL